MPVKMVSYSVAGWGIIGVKAILVTGVKLIINMLLVALNDGTPEYSLFDSVWSLDFTIWRLNNHALYRFGAAVDAVNPS